MSSLGNENSIHCIYVLYCLQIFLFKSCLHKLLFKGQNPFWSDALTHIICVFLFFAVRKPQEVECGPQTRRKGLIERAREVHTAADAAPAPPLGRYFHTCGCHWFYTSSSYTLLFCAFFLFFLQPLCMVLLWTNRVPFSHCPYYIRPRDNNASLPLPLSSRSFSLYSATSETFTARAKAGARLPLFINS